MHTYSPADALRFKGNILSKYQYPKSEIKKGTMKHIPYEHAAGSVANAQVVPYRDIVYAINLVV